MKEGAERAAGSGGADIFFNKKHPRLPEIVAKERVTRPLIDAPRGNLNSTLGYENGIPVHRVASAGLPRAYTTRKARHRVHNTTEG